MKRDGLWLGCGSFILYALLLTQQYAGDGLRWVSSITGPWPPVLGGTNHLLFPLVGWAWYHAIGSWLGNALRLQSIQLLNAAGAAVGVALFGQIVRRLGANRLAMWLACLCLIFAHAYWINATDMVEVMLSIPLIFLAIWLVLPETNTDTPLRWWRCVLAGSALAVATAIYQASAFSLLALCAAVWWQPTQVSYRRERLRNLLLTVNSFALVVAAIYLGSFRLLGNAATWTEALRSSLATESPAAFGRLDPRHLGGSLFGWVSAWLSLFDFQGVSHLLRAGFNLTLFINLLLMTVQYGLWIIIAWPTWRQRKSLSARERSSLKIILAWFLPPFLFTAYWLPAYDKLWISPLAATIAAFAVLLTRSQSASSRSAALAKAAAFTLCGLTIVINLAFGLLPARFAPNIYLTEAVQLAERIQAHDLVITDGWGPSATYYEAFTQKPRLGYAGIALAHPGDNQTVSTYLAQQIAIAQSQGGTVYFLGVLDLDAADWQPLFGDRFGMDFAQLAPYRAIAKPIISLSEKTLSGQPLHLWALPPLPNKPIQSAP